MQSPKELVLKSVGYVGVALNLHRVFQPQPLAILMYHAVVNKDLPVKDWCFISSRDFRRQLEYLKATFDVLPLSAAIKRQHAPPAERPIATITFDDGYQNNFDIAFPILRDLGLPATVFLCTNLIDSDDTLWFCRLNEALTLATLPAFEWQGAVYRIATPELKERTSCLIQAKLKKMPPHLLKVQLGEICRKLGYQWDSPINASSPFRMLDSASICEMSHSGLIEFGAHTASHAILSRLDKTSQTLEIEASIERVHQLTGRTCRFFAYPNGGTEDYNEDSLTCLKRHGIRAALTTVSRRNLADTNLLELGRYGIGSNMSDTLFRSTVHHFSGMMTKWAR